MATFVAKLWNKIKKPVVKTVATVGNLILPGAGSVVSNLVDKIPTMAEKAAVQGTVKTEKVAQTLAANNLPVNDKNVTELTQAVQKAAAQIVADPTKESAEKLTVDTSALSTMGKIKLWLTTKWYIPVLVIVFFYLILSGKKGSKYSSKKRYYGK